MDLLDRPPKGTARTSDPATSKAAGKAATEPSAKLRASQARVLSVFRAYGPMHDGQLVDFVHDLEKSMGLTADQLMSPSGVRSRRSELSKPNMERLNELAREKVIDAKDFDDLTATAQHIVRGHLRREGFRSPLWDSGRRETVKGRSVIVWEIAV
jgi:hypothetical protein